MGANMMRAINPRISFEFLFLLKFGIVFHNTGIFIYIMVGSYIVAEFDLLDMLAKRFEFGSAKTAGCFFRL